jgi:hypothetical protein
MRRCFLALARRGKSRAPAVAPAVAPAAVSATGSDEEDLALGHMIDASCSPPAELGAINEEGGLRAPTVSPTVAARVFTARCAELLRPAQHGDKIGARRALAAHWNAQVFPVVATVETLRDVAFITGFMQREASLRLPVQSHARLWGIVDGQGSADGAARDAVQVLRALTGLGAADAAQHDVTCRLLQRHVVATAPPHVDTVVDAVHCVATFAPRSATEDSDRDLVASVLRAAAGRAPDMKMTALVGAIGACRKLAVRNRRAHRRGAGDCAAALARQVRRRDDRLVNAFHFAQIVFALDQLAVQDAALWQYLVDKYAAAGFEAKLPPHVAGNVARALGVAEE